MANSFRGLGGKYYDTEDPEQVKGLQQELNTRGYNVAVDGQYGPETDTAYRDANSKEYGGTQNPSDSRQNLGDNPNIAPGLPGSSFGENNPYGDPNFDISTRPDLQQWQQDNLGNPTTPEEEASAVEQMVAARELAARRYELTTQAQEASKQTRLDAEKLLQERKAARKTGLLGRIAQVGTKFLDTLGKPFEEGIAQPYEAGNRARLIGGNTLQQSQATIAGLPGLGFLAPKGSLAKKAIEQTNSPEERAALTKAGQLSSFGEQISGKAQDTLDPSLRDRAASGPLPGTKLPSPIRGVVSGASDFALNVFGDPLNVVFPGPTSLADSAAAGVLKGAAGAKLAGDTAGLGRRAFEAVAGREAKRLATTDLGVSAQRAGRAAVADGRLGQAVIDAAVEAVRKGARDVTELSKKVKGLEGPIAENVLKAARTGGEADVRAALREALVSGEWNPELGTLRKVLGSTTGLGVSGGIVKGDRVTAALRQFVRGTGEGLATGLSRDAGQVLERTVQRAAEHSGSFVGDLRTIVGDDVRKLDPSNRATRLIKLANESDNAAFRDATREELARAFKSADPNEVDHILSRLETVQVVLEGKAGGAAKTQAEAELRQGFRQGLKLDSGRNITERAIRNMGVDPPDPTAVAAATKALKKGGKDAVAGLRQEIKTLEPELRDPLLADLRAAVKSKKGLGRVAADLQVLQSPTVGPEALRLVQNSGERALQAVPPEVERAGLGKRVLQTAAKLPLSLAEAVSPSHIAFQGGGTHTQQVLHRVEGADRWAAELGLDDTARSALRQSAESAKTEAELYEAVSESVREFAVRAGVDPDQLEAMYRAQYQHFKANAPKRAFGVDVHGNPIKENIFTQAQLVEQIPLPDAGDLRNAARKLRDGVGVDEIRGLADAGEAASKTLLGQVLAKGHRVWKFSTVTNAYLPLVGAAAGFGSGEGWQDRLKRGATGFGIGMLGPARYVLRVPLMEERLRVYMSRGFTPSEWVPGVAAWAARRGVDLPFVSEDIVHASNVLDRLVGGRLLSTAGSDYVSLAKTDARFPDAWWRVLNRQINPESDEVARILLNEKAGVFTAEQAKAEIDKFMKTEDGKVFKNRMMGGTGGTSSSKTIIDRYRQFFDTYVTDPDIARARLQVADKRLAGEVDAEIARDTIKEAIGKGMSPDFVHAQQTWVVPKTVRQAVATNNKILSNLVFEGPTSNINRVPLARSIYRDEYLRLERAGVDPRRAQEIADAIAVRRTNKIMFQVNDESRFAKKADYIFPFQQPREEFFHVWGPLVKENPGRAMKTTRLAALAFNNGQHQGIFRKDPLTHQWVMSVPHSAWLGDKLFGGLGNMDANLKDLLLPAQGAFTPGLGIIPNPGGPWIGTVEKYWAVNHPDAYQNMPKELKGLLFPYGIKGNLMRPEAARLWMGMTGSVPPWEFADRKDQQNELDKWTKEIYKQLKFDHWQKTGDAEWEPTGDDMKQHLRSFMELWSVVGSTFPASPNPIMPGAGAVDKIFAAHTDANGKVDWDTINRDYPIVALYRTSGSKYVGPDDYHHWMDSEDVTKRGEQFQLGLRQQLTLDEFKDTIKAAKDRSAALADYANIFAQPGSAWEREAALQDWREKNPQLAKEQRDDYFKKAELDHILATVPRNLQPEFIDNWRKTYDVSQKDFQKLRDTVTSGGPGYNPSSPWRTARYAEDVATDVAQHVRHGVGEEAYVSTLNPAEQVGYWKTKQSQLNDYTGGKNPQAILDDYAKFGTYISAVYRAHPELNTPAPGASFNPSNFNQRILQPYNDRISEAYAEAARLKDAMDTAANNKQWTDVYAMKDKRDALFDQVKSLKNEMTGKFPALDGNTDLQALMVFANDKRAISSFNASPAAGTLPWIVSNEEAHYLNMPGNVQKSYVQDLVNQVNQPSGTSGKLFWQWLTDFQQNLLTKNLPADQIRQLRGESPSTGGGTGSGTADAKGFTWVQTNGKWVLYYKGSPYKSGGGTGFSGKFYGANNTLATGAGELAYALEMFAQYNKRGEGTTAPATYNTYLALPNNPAVRAQYLKAHPEVGDWIKNGPLANMPELERYIVTNIMVKYGKWDGDVKSDAEITDLSFAREQLKRWTQRPEGASAPDAYQAWLDMPPGVEKALYLKAHPEVTDWLKLGPMANMPQEYQTVVRDIMIRYGEWSQQQDPLGGVIGEYYRTPAYARQKFLEQHPELSEYWAAIRSPQDQALSNLSDQYFSMQSPTAKKALLLAHPELQQHFLDARNKRYEQFVNQVAQYMGGNPDMFKDYLTRQNDILAELLRRYAEPGLLREVTQGIKSQSTQGTKKRAA